MKLPSWLLVLAVVAIAAIPLLVAQGASFGGADTQAVAAVQELRPGYTPWVRPLFLPPGAEVEGALFALQAAGGAAVIAYVIGYRRGRRRADRP
jgi:cobalt/nickel transport protein